MKSGKLLIFLVLLALALGVLTATAHAAPTGPDTDMRPVAPKAATATQSAAQTLPASGGIESLSGSFVAFDPSVGGATCFIPGQTQTFCFRAESFTTDWEYVYNVWQRFPTDWTVTNVYVQGTPTCDSTGSFGAFSWSWETSPYEVNIYHPRYHANPSDHCTAYYCFDVISGSGTPNALESWYWDGDGYGNPPHWPCSSDVYTPASMATQPCDEWVNPQASIPPCQPQPYEWLKYVNGARWDPTIQVTVQTSDTIQVTEIVTTSLPFNLVENWNPAHLRLLDWNVSPGGMVITSTGFLEWHQTPSGPGPWYLIKWFHVEPCTWTDTVLDEVLYVSGLPPEPRPVPIIKVPPLLWIDAVGGGPVWAGQPAGFTLLYGNNGGYENNVVIYNNFPPGAPFVSSVPPPDIISPDRLFAQWFVGDLPQSAMGNIAVTVMVQPNLPPSTTLEIWDYIFDHTNQLRGSVMIPFHVEPWITWDKTIDGIPWAAGMEITRQTSDTIVVQEVLHLTPPLSALKIAVAPVLAPLGSPPDHPADPTTQVSRPFKPVAPRNPEAVLWDQSAAQSWAGMSDYFTNLSLGVFSADDFQNPLPWAIDTIFVDGWDTAANLPRASLLTWYIYPDAGGIPAGYPGDGSGTELWSLSLPPNDPAVTIGLGTFDDVTLNVIQATGGPLNLPPGHYWLVFYPSLDRTPGAYFWRFATSSNLSHPRVVDPTNYLGYGWTNWTDWTVSNPDFTDMVFRLEGTTVPPPVYAQIETWDPANLHLLNWAATGGNVIVEPNRLVWTGEVAAPTTITLTKWFHVEPCTWTQTVLWEELWLDLVELEQRPVVIHKLPPELWIDAAYQPGVLAGFPANFTLSYGNTGGFDNDVWVRNTFPPEAPFVSSIPPATNVDPNGLWAEWFLGGLPQGAQGNIDVTVMISPTVPPSTTIEIWDGILDHTGELRDWVLITFHVNPAFDWIKLVNGVPWDPDLVVTVQTSDTIVITDTVASPLDRHLIENWNMAHLQLINAWADCGDVVVGPGHLEWHVLPGMPPCTLTKLFHVEPCTWTDTLLEEVLTVDNLEPVFRPVQIHKVPSQLWIDFQGGGPVLAGQPADFTLLYGNTGGFENAAMVRNDFPPTAPFVASTPPPNRQDPNGLWAEWDIGGLSTGDMGSIDVTVMISPTVPPSTTIEIWDGILDHAGNLVDWVVITFHVEQPPLIVEWEKYVDGVLWQPGMDITRQTSETIEVLEVIHIVPPPLTTGEPKPVTPQANADTAPSSRAPIGTLALGDLLFEIPAETATGNNLLLGVEFAFGYYWVTGADPAGGVGWLYKIDVTGTLVATYPQAPGCTGWGARDLCADDSYLYYGCDNGLIHQVDPATGAPTGVTIPDPITPARALAYDPATDHFWTANWDSNLYEISRTGAIINMFPPAGLSTYGMAWDPWSAGGPFLWLWSQDGPDPLLLASQVNPASGGPTGVTFLGSGVPGEMAGGAAISKQVVPGMAVFIGMNQGVTDRIGVYELAAVPPAFAQIETWDPTKLHLVDWAATGGEVIVEPNRLVWTGDLIEPTTITLTKWFHVEPCTWTVTTLWEELWLDDVELEQRPVVIHKLPSNLWIDAVGGGPVWAGRLAQFALLFGNTGGFENDVWIRNDFPPTAPFAGSVPPPTNVDPNGLWAEWYLAGLPQNAQGTIDVTVQITDTAPTSTTITIIDYIFDHVGQETDRVTITFHVAPRIYLPLVFKNYVSGP